MKVVLLSRSNALRVLVSRMAARQTGVYATPHASSPVRIRLHSGSLARRPRRIEGENQSLTEKTRHHTRYMMAYHDLHDERRRGYLLESLWVEEHPLSFPLKRILPRDLTSCIDNDAEVRSALEGTCFARYLDEGPGSDGR